MSTSAQIVPEPINISPSKVPAIGIISGPSRSSSSLFQPTITTIKMVSASVKMKTPIPAPIKYKDLLISLRGGEDLGSGPELGAISKMDDLSSMGKYYCIRGINKN